MVSLTVHRKQLIIKKAKIYSTTHVQLLQWLHGKQQQQMTSTNLKRMMQSVSCLGIGGIRVDRGEHKLTYAPAPRSQEQGPHVDRYFKRGIYFTKCFDRGMGMAAGL